MQKQEEYRILVWLDPNVNDKYNKSNQDMIKKVGNIELIICTKVSECITKILEIKCKKTIIMVSAKLAKSLFNKINDNIDKLSIIPRIIIFTGKQTMESIKKNPKEFEKYPFFKKDLVITQLGVLITELKKEIKYEPKIGMKTINFSKCFQFDIVNSIDDLVIPIKFSNAIKKPSNQEINHFNKFLLDNFSSNPHIKYLIEQTIQYTNIPFEIIVKYWLRVYSMDSQFIKEMNNSLSKKDSNSNMYNIFVRCIFSALKEKIIKPLNNKTLYIGTKISKEEIYSIQKFLSSKKEGLPGCYTYNTGCISTYFNENLIDIFMDKITLEKNEFYSFFEIEYNDKIKDEKIPNVNLKEYSYSGENEVLFLPYSSFEVLNIEKKTKNNKEYYHIKLVYLGKYENIISEIDKKKIKQSSYVNNIISSSLISNVPSNNSEKKSDEFDIPVYNDSLIDLIIS